MVDYKYSNFLPNYLDGENIRNHASNIERQDKIIATKNLMLRNWNRLTPVILIERVCSLDESVNPAVLCLDYYLHVSVDEFIKRVEVNGEVISEFLVEEAVMEYTQSILHRSLPDGDFWNNPLVRVDVYTYDDNVYSKGYPENDVVRGDVFDHDEALDRIGAIMGLERRTYNRYDSSEGAGSVPTYWGKSVDSEGIVGVCTEDDYYYLQRLLYLITHYQSMDLCQLYMFLTYNVELRVSHDYSRFGVARGNFLYVIPLGYVFPVNIDAPPINTELSADVYLGRFIPVTREAYVVWDVDSYSISVDFLYTDGVRLLTVLDRNGRPWVGLHFLNPYFEDGEDLITDKHGQLLLYQSVNGMIQDLITADKMIQPISGDTHLPEAWEEYSLFDPDNWSTDGVGDMVFDEDSITISTDKGLFTPRLNFDYRDTTSFNYYLEPQVEDVTHPNQSGVHISLSSSSVPLAFSTFKRFYIRENDILILDENNQITKTIQGHSLNLDFFYIESYDEQGSFRLTGLKSYVSRDVPVPVIPTTMYGLGTDNPWTTSNTLNAIFDSNHPGWLITTYVKQSTGTTVNIPLQGDFEIEVKLNIMSTSGVQGTAIFGLYDSQRNNVFTVTQDNKLNGQTINTVYPNCDYFGALETFTLKREGTSYTYKHGEETRTLTINNTGTLYFKMTKTGNADLGMSTMGVTEL